MKPYTPDPPITCVRLLISVALGACHARSTVDAAVPWRARDAATAAMKPIPGFERIVEASWTTRRYIETTTNTGMSLGIQMATWVDDDEVGVSIHDVGGLSHLYVGEVSRAEYVYPDNVVNRN